MLARFPGTRLEGAVFRHPFLDRDSIGLLGDHVTLEQGTGAVHTAPGHGQEDFVIGQRYGLPVYCPVDAGGRMFQAEGATGILPDELIGKTVWDANPIVMRLLEQHGALARQEPGRPQLSALLALPQSGDLPRHRTVVHRHGPRESARSSAGRHLSAWSGIPSGAKSASPT